MSRGAIAVLTMLWLGALACHSPDPDRDLDGSPASRDCDDTDPRTYPGADEVCEDGIDQNCDGGDEPCPDAEQDWDQDGFDAIEYGGADCNDQRSDVYPGAPEVPYDGIDQDCSGEDLVDVDGDGQAATEAGGEDCNDAAATVYLGAAETPYDGVDQDCDGSDTVDVDGDGVPGIPAGGDDCDDEDAGVYPGAEELPENGVDENCDGLDDIDQDSDGHGAADDCDDSDPGVYPGAVETPCNELDEDCDGYVEDRDCDGVDGPPLGPDCDDTDPDISPLAPEVPCNGIDENCDGFAGDEDCDGVDGSNTGGADCDDLNAAVYPGAIEVLNNDRDDDCDGSVDEPAHAGDASSGFWGPAGSHAGAALAVGDLDGDGVPDLAIGAPAYAGEQEPATGAVFVVAGGRESLESELLEPSSLLVGQADGEYFGASLAIGDVDGDGTNDLIIGAPGRPDDPTFAGKVYVVSGSVLPFSGTVVALALVVEGAEVGSRFGAAVAVPGDVNGDGVDDFLIGAPESTCGAGAACGAAYFFLGSSSAVPPAPGSADLLWTGTENGERTGAYVAGTGDIDQDGMADMAIGSPGANAGIGLVSFFLGRDHATHWPDDRVKTVVVSLEDTQPIGLGPVAECGDINQDGHVDLLLGAPGDADDTGRTYVLFGPWLQESQQVYEIERLSHASFLGEGEGDRFGSVFRTGWVSGGAFADVLVGAAAHDGSSGRLYLFQAAGGKVWG